MQQLNSHCFRPSAVSDILLFDKRGNPPSILQSRLYWEFTSFWCEWLGSNQPHSFNRINSIVETDLPILWFVSIILPFRFSTAFSSYCFHLMHWPVKAPLQFYCPGLQFLNDFERMPWRLVFPWIYNLWCNQCLDLFTFKVVTSLVWWFIAYLHPGHIFLKFCYMTGNCI